MKNNDDIPATDTTEIKQLINRVKQGKLDQGDAQLIEKLLNILLTIVSLLQRKHTSIRRMKDLLFGMKEKKQGKDEAKNRAEESRSGAEESSQADSPKGSASSSTCEGDASTQEVRRLKRPGHGRKAASDYPRARLVRLNHPEMAPGDPCPESGCEGHLHQLEQPNVKIYLTGRPLISATKYERLVLRCSDCFKRYAADLPEGVKEKEKFDETADVAIALYKYSGGMPFYRQARMQESCGVPLPESVQFERCEEVANAVFPVYRHLVELSADGKLFHIDDTRVRILSCYREDKDRSEKERRATHTSGFVVKDEGDHKIALYFSGRRHAGENLDDVLEKRDPALPTPIKMSDAAAVNGKKRAQTIDANCLAHGRGKFKELEEIFPVECGQVMEAIRKVYQYDDQTKGMGDQERLEYHQKHSGPVMRELHEWIEGEFRNRRVEPNSSLGKAFQYLLNHFEKLTRFLSAPGTPIDNNEAERVLKRFVLFRKNSLFYKTEHGAAVGGILINGMDKEAPASVYWPILAANIGGADVFDFALRNATFAIRSPRAGSEGLMNEIRQAVWSVAPYLPVGEVNTLNYYYTRSMARTSFTLVMLVVAGTMGLFLGVVGLYGVIAYSVSQRRREIGIRMALGAGKSAVLKMVISQGIKLALIGVTIGLAGALGLTRFLSGFLYGVKPSDPLTLVAVSALLMAVALFASYIPARQAAKVDPLVALRHE